jgi:hypothetical protein
MNRARLAPVFLLVAATAACSASMAPPRLVRSTTGLKIVCAAPRLYNHAVACDDRRCAVGFASEAIKQAIEGSFLDRKHFVFLGFTDRTLSPIAAKMSLVADHKPVAPPAESLHLVATGHGFVVLYPTPEGLHYSSFDREGGPALSRRPLAAVAAGARVLGVGHHGGELLILVASSPGNLYDRRAGAIDLVRFNPATSATRTSTRFIEPCNEVARAKVHVRAGTIHVAWVDSKSSPVDATKSFTVTPVFRLASGPLAASRATVQELALEGKVGGTSLTDVGFPDGAELVLAIRDGDRRWLQRIAPDGKLQGAPEPSEDPRVKRFLEECTGQSCPPAPVVVVGEP